MFRTGSLFDPAVRRGGCEPEVTAYYFKKWQGYAMDYHRHDATEIMYVMEEAASSRPSWGRRWSRAAPPAA